MFATGVLVLLIALGGVDFELGYFWHLTKGQMSLLWRAKPIARVLNDKNLDPATRKKLLLVEDLRAFARDEIGLASSRNYTTYVDIGQGPVSWNLVVCSKDKLTPETWTYPVVGTVPYRGYFRQDQAEEARAAFEQMGFDTYLRPVSAYSTLGWFPDPILSTMLHYDEADLADLVFHELTHATLWIEGDVTFNESLASFVGEAGALMWLEKKYGKDGPRVQEVRDANADALIFRKFMHQIATQLDSLYQSQQSKQDKLAQREFIFEDAKKRFFDLPLKTRRYDGFPSLELNNARLALYRVYRARTNVFQRVYAATNHNLPAALQVFKKCETASDPTACLELWVEKNEH